MQIATWTALALLVGALGAKAPEKPATDTRAKNEIQSGASAAAPGSSSVATIAATSTALRSDDAAIAAGMVALCQDGNYSDNSNLAATCSSGGGLQRWLAKYGTCADGTVIVMKSTSSCASRGNFKGLAPGYEPTPQAKDLARCMNGLYSDNRDLGNTCSANDGVAEWLAPFGRCVDGTLIRMSATDSCGGHDGFSALESKEFVPTPGDLDLAKCKDGTYSSNRSMSATCSSRGGVEAWLAAYGQCENGAIVLLAEQNCGSSSLLALLPGYNPPAVGAQSSATPVTPSGVVSPELLDATFGVLMDLKGVDRAAAKSAAQTFCRAIDSNGGDVARTMAQAAVIIAAEHMNAELVGAVIGAGVAAYCPQYKDALDHLTGG